MRREKILYWIATGLVALSGLMAGIMYFANPNVAIEFTHLGFPNYFRIELGVAKIFGAFTLILPMVAGRIKEWAYAGFAITYISACLAHIAEQEVVAAIPPFITLIVLVISYVYYTKVKHNSSI